MSSEILSVYHFISFTSQMAGSHTPKMHNAKCKCRLSSAHLKLWQSQYRVALVLGQLGWVDLKLGSPQQQCSRGCWAAFCGSLQSKQDGGTNNAITKSNRPNCQHYKAGPWHLSFYASLHVSFHISVFWYAASCYIAHQLFSWLRFISMSYFGNVSANRENKATKCV